MLCRGNFALHATILALVDLVAWGKAGFAQTTHPISGRRIAPVMSVEGAEWLDREERGREERPDRALSALGLKPGMQVGDVGAGTGFYSLRIARLVSPGGKVYANDLQREMLETIRQKAQAQSISNIEEVKGTASDCELPPNALDLVILVDVYHEFSQPQKMLASIRRSLKADGRLALLEFRGEDETVPIRPEHKMTLKQVRTEITPEGFRFEKSVETLPWQHIVLFRKDGP